MNVHSKIIRGFETCITTRFSVAMIVYDAQMYVFTPWMPSNELRQLHSMYCCIYKNPHGWTYQKIHAIECASCLHCPLSCKSWKKRVEFIMALMWIIMDDTRVKI